MKVVGLTGSIASGKSTVSTALKSWGAVVLDADETAHRLMEKGQAAWQAVVESFGPEILQPDGNIDRVALGNIIFRNESFRLRLNAISHPLILADIETALETLAKEQPDSIVFVEVPLLFECAWESRFAEIWTVWVDPTTQLHRLMMRNSLDEEAALNRIQSQLPLDEKARRSDRVIDNTGTMEATWQQARNFYRAILSDSAIG